MSPEQFKQRQASLGWTNAKMAAHLRKTPQSVSNYRNMRQRIPAHVDVLLEAALRTLRDAPPRFSVSARPAASQR